MKGEQERGSAVIEFTALAVLLLVPIIYLIVAMARLQAGTYAVAVAAREAARAFVTSPTEGSALARANAAAGLAFGDQGFASAGTIQVSCQASPCLTPQATMSVTADLQVELPGVPSVVAAAIPTSVGLSATHVLTVDRFRDAP